MSRVPIITHYSLVRNGTLEIDGRQLLQGFEDLDSLLKAGYEATGGGYRKFFKMDRLCKLGFLASEMLVQSRGGWKGIDRSQVGVILANASASLDTDRAHQDSISDPKQYYPSPAVFVYTLPNIVIGEICIRQGVSGENCFFIFDRFDPGPLVTYIADLLQTGQTKACLGGWLEVDEEEYEGFMFLAEPAIDVHNNKPLTADWLAALYRNPTKQWNL